MANLGSSRLVQQGNPMPHAAHWIARRILEDSEWELLPVLADALEEEGFTDERVLTLLRDRKRYFDRYVKDRPPCLFGPFFDDPLPLDCEHWINTCSQGEATFTVLYPLAMITPGFTWTVGENLVFPISHHIFWSGINRQVIAQAAERDIARAAEQSREPSPLDRRGSTPAVTPNEVRIRIDSVPSSDRFPSRRIYPTGRALPARSTGRSAGIRAGRPRRTR